MNKNRFQHAEFSVELYYGLGILKLIEFESVMNMVWSKLDSRWVSQRWVKPWVSKSSLPLSCSPLFLTRLTMKDVNADWYTLLALIYGFTVFYYRKLARVKRKRTVIWNDHIIWSADIRDSSLIRTDDSASREFLIFKAWCLVGDFRVDLVIKKYHQHHRKWKDYANGPGELCIDVNKLKTVSDCHP